MRLNDWQQAIEAYLLGADAAPNAALQASLIGSPNLSVTQGLAIYHHAYRAQDLITVLHLPLHGSEPMQHLSQLKLPDFLYVKYMFIPDCIQCTVML